MYTNKGFRYALASAGLMGLAPIFGKQALLVGLGALPLVALRTAGAAILLLLLILFFKRSNLTIYPIGLMGCLIAGSLNGIGSILYYSSLARIDASLGQLLFMMYPIMIAVVFYLDGQRPSRVTILRLGLSIPAVYLLTYNVSSSIDLIGAAMMLMAAFLYAIHIPINQRVLYEVPAPTVTLYTLLAMTVVVLVAFLLGSQPLIPIPAEAVQPIMLLTAVTFISRLTLFAGVKFIGGIQTSLIGLGELVVTIFFSFLLLGESLTGLQWLGALILILSLISGGFDRKPTQRARTRGWLYWLRPPVPPALVAVEEKGENPKPQPDPRPE